MAHIHAVAFGRRSLYLRFDALACSSVATRLQVCARMARFMMRRNDERFFPFQPDAIGGGCGGMVAGRH